MNMKKYLSILSSMAVVLTLVCAMTTRVNAAVKAYIVNDNGKIISFNADALTADYVNKLLGKTSPMFDAYLARVSNLTAFQDSVKGFVSYESVISAYEKAIATGGDAGFNVDNFTENAGAADIKNITVGYEWKDGAITVVSGVPAATIENVGTDIPGKTVVVTSLPSTVDASQYSLSIDGQVMSYDASTKKFTITLDGTFTKQDLENKIVVSLNENNTSDDFDVEDIY